MSSRAKSRPVACRAAFLALTLAPALLLFGGEPLRSAPAPDGRPVVTVGVVFDGPKPAGEQVVLMKTRDDLLEIIKQETKALTHREFDVRFPESKQLAGDWTNPGIRAAIDRLLADPEVDLVLSLGSFATNLLARGGEPPKPVVCAWALDVEAQGLPFERGATGVRNLSYLVSPGSILRDLETFKDVARISSVHVLVDSRFLESIPEVPEFVLAAAEQLGLELTPLPTDVSAEEALALLPADAQGVYVTPLLRMPVSEFKRLVAGLIERRLPSFSLIGRDDVELGILAGSRPTTEVPRLGRRMALSVQRILLGEDAGTLSVTLDQSEKLAINIATAQAIALYPAWRVLIDAEAVNDTRRTGGRTLTLFDAVAEAVDANLSLRATERAVAAGYESIRIARSALRPQVGASAGGLRIDKDRALASFGSQAETTVSGKISLTQLLYSDAARANTAISRSLQESLLEEQQIERLDLALDAAIAFLNVLRAETLERVESDNLRLTTSNLELARRREKVGASGPADVYRWEAQLATDRSAVLTAQNQVQSVRIRLNQLLNRPLEEPFVAAPPELADPNLSTGFGRLRPYVEDPDSFSVFREFTAKEGLGNSPELQAIDAAIAAQQRAELAARRAYWSPTVAVSGELERQISKAGAGDSVTPLLPVSPADRENWSIALSATLPLFQGGGRRAEARQASEELAALRLQREFLAEQVEARIRTVLFDVASRYTAIELSKEAADAARRNLELVTDAYSRGVLSIIELLDAQTALLVAEEFTSNAVYDFLIDLMRCQRASNSFDFFISKEGRQAWFERLERFFATAGFRGRPASR